MIFLGARVGNRFDGHGLRDGLEILWRYAECSAAKRGAPSCESSGKRQVLQKRTDRCLPAFEEPCPPAKRSKVRRLLYLIGSIVEDASGSGEGLQSGAASHKLSR